jgi:hypothetical protein
VALTSKLTDANNVQQPQLASQRIAVKAFHSRSAKEVEATSLAASKSIPASSSAHTTPSITQSKCNISAVTNKDTDNNVEDENSDDQPKRCKYFAFMSQVVN